jgi:1-phosphofructokinase family hexose kinase
LIADSLKEIGIPGRFVETHGESRTCIANLDLTTHSQTELNENGPHVSPEEVAALLRQFEELLGDGATDVALCGSLPPGCPASLYAEMIALAKAKGIRSALDASGEALKLGAEARPHLVKCNLTELRYLLPDAGDSPEEIACAGRSLLAGGTQEAAITMGAKGAVLVTEAGAWFAAPPPIQFISAVGSGDAFLAAYLWARENGEPPDSCLEWGVGAGAANAAVMGAGFCAKPEIVRRREKTQSRRIA